MRAIYEPSVGDIVDRYRIDAELGRGGMGVVFRATHLGLDAPRALKVVSPALAGDAAFRRRFEREARLASSLRHPNVATVHDFGEAAGTLFLVMELLDGRDVAQVAAGQGPLSPERAVAVVADVAAALDAAHAAGLVHRDVKPQNVIVTRERTYLTDFGLTREVRTESDLTLPEQAPGTPGYMAPEQIEGAQVDARTDVYALGCLLFFALTGHSPRGWCPDEPLPPSGTALDAVIARARARRPADRFPTAGALAAAARASLGEVADATELESSPQAAAPPAPRRRRPILLAAALVTALAFSAPLALRGDGDGERPMPTPEPTTVPSSTPGPRAGDGSPLLARVPAPLQASCRDEPALPGGARAGLACAVAGADDLHYFDFGDPAAAAADYESTAARAQAVRSAGDCESGLLPAEEDVDGARRLCHVDAEGGHVVAVHGEVQIRLTAATGWSPGLLDAYDAARPR